MHAKHNHAYYDNTQHGARANATPNSCHVLSSISLSSNNCKAIAKAYTLTLKEKGAEAAEKELKKQLKNQAKKHKKGL